jgi:hypothetical protein
MSMNIDFGTALYKGLLASAALLVLVGLVLIIKLMASIGRADKTDGNWFLGIFSVCWRRLRTVVKLLRRKLWDMQTSKKVLIASVTPVASIILVLGLTRPICRISGVRALGS